MSRLSLAALCVCATLGTPVFAAEQSRALSGFDSIKERGAFNLTVVVGKPFSVTVRGDDAFVERVSTEVLGGELVISHKSTHHLQLSSEQQIIVTLPEFKRCRLEGAGMTSLQQLSGKEFELNFEGTGMLTAQGKVQSFYLKAKGVGHIDARELQADITDVSLEGIGNVSVYAKNKLRARVQGIGALTYYGHPAQVNKSMEGLGSLHPGD